MQPGDILFYTEKPGDRWDHLIAAATGGTYVHCGVARSTWQSIEALTQGVELVSNPAPSAVAPFADLATVPAALDTALLWLNRQIGDGYGWLDTTWNQLGRFLPFRTPLLVQPHAYDCSELATRFLMLASCRILTNDMIHRPQQVSPNDLARVLLRPPAASAAVAAPAAAA